MIKIKRAKICLGGLFKARCSLIPLAPTPATYPSASEGLAPRPSALWGPVHGPSGLPVPAAQAASGKSRLYPGLASDLPFSSYYLQGCDTLPWQKVFLMLLTLSFFFFLFFKF